MPELPEVETVANALRPHLLGRQILRVTTHTARLRTPLTVAKEPAIRGQTVVAVRRRAKFILVDLANQWTVLVHLGMTGHCRIAPAAEPRKTHEHVIFHLDDGLTWRFGDPRRFGMVEAWLLPTPGGEPASLAELGPEPLSDAFTAEYLLAQCAGRSRPIKPLLMDNAVVVGVGNIYASESLFRAGIRPTTAAGKIRLPRLTLLVQEIRAVLTAAIAAGGTTIIDFAAPDGKYGFFIDELQVYGHEGEPCRRCGKGPIRRLVQTGRSTFYCPHCQK